MAFAGSTRKPMYCGHLLELESDTGMADIPAFVE